MKYRLLFLSFLLLSACQIKAPDNGTELGSEVKETDVLHSIDDVYKGYTAEKAFRKEDWGRVQIIDKSMANQVIRQTHEFKVIDVTDAEITYDEYIIETNEGFRYVLKKKGSPDQSKMKTGPKSNVANLFMHFFKLLGSVSFEKPTASAEESGINVSSESIRSQNFNLLSLIENKFLSPLNLGEISFAEFQTMENSSRYFGLKILKHKVATANCAQFQDCKVNTTQVTFNQIRKNKEGVDVRFHHLYELSTEVPGIFSPMSGHPIVNAVEFCISTLIANGEAQIPFTRCVHLQDFRLGAPSASISSAKTFRLDGPVVTPKKLSH